MTTSVENDIRPPLADLLRAARTVGEALCRARGRDPLSYLRALPSWLSVLPVDLQALYRHDDALWSEIAHHHGQSLEEYRQELHDIFEPVFSSTLGIFRCIGCGIVDVTVWEKDGVDHWRGGRGDEPFEVICGQWQPIETGR